MKVKYTGPAGDYSGYGECSRHDIGALVEAGVNVATQIPKYTLEISDFGKLGQLAQSLLDKELGYQTKILHTTPNVYPNYMEPGKYHVGRVFWETDKLPLDFATNVQLMNEIWTGSQFNAQAIRNAGVTKPIYIIPEAIDINIGNFEPYMVANEKDYKFYSIFEWTERKNPYALLKAFWEEFENTDGVSLTIKTYVDNFTPGKKDEINQYIKRIKKQLNLKKYAPVYLYRNLMDRNQIYRFHTTFDCFVSAHRGEGWGIPQMEALLMERAVISTNCGGIHEYLEDKKSAMLIPYKLVPLSGNNRNKQWYTTDQHWAEVDVDKLKEAMRYVFKNQAKARTMAKEGKEIVHSFFSLKAVGTKMLERLQAIQEALAPDYTRV